MFESVIALIRDLYPAQTTIPLHEPRFQGREREYVLAAIDSTFVSSVGAFVDRLEAEVVRYTGTAQAVATVNGTAALHIALLLAGVQPGDEVITQPLTFVATANAIAYCGATPVFVDVDRRCAGLSPEALAAFLDQETRRQDGVLLNRSSGRRIAACLPVHTFGLPAAIERLVATCAEHGLPVVEDAAEALGSTWQGRHCGTFGLLGIYSLNGNKTITAGGGGIIVTSDPVLARQAKHLTTTAKRLHPYLYDHDALGYNYRMPNLNAALACAQLEQLEAFVAAKRTVAARYQAFFATSGLTFLEEPAGGRANCWLNSILLPDRAARDLFLAETHRAGILTRPAWRLLNELPMYRSCRHDGLANARWLADRLVNLPSSVPAGARP
ncbi:MAG: LegC family aminotransferase [Thermodesulfobacteriota bacterium]